MKHYLSTKVRVILVVAVLLAALLAVLNNLTGLNLGENVMQSVLVPIRTGVSKLRDQAEQVYSYIFNYEALLAENIALKEKIAQMEDDARVADSVSRENARLKALLNLVDTHEDYKLVDAYIIAWGSNDWTSTITINRGANVGIEAGMCAITANGELVGQVTEVGSNYAVVKTILDSSLGISATIASSGYNGMVQGNYTSGDEDLLRMNYLPTSSVIRNKDTVVTSGSTSYPRDLVLGYVIDAGFADTGVAKYALLQPAVDIDTLEQVFILTEYNAG
jgi:rod shape-determining protein MreC